MSIHISVSRASVPSLGRRAIFTHGSRVSRAEHLFGQSMQLNWVNGVNGKSIFLCRKCPQTLVAPIIKLALEKTKQSLSKTPEQFGYSAKTSGECVFYNPTLDS